MNKAGHDRGNKETMSSGNRTHLFITFALGLIGLCFLILFYRIIVEPGHWKFLPPLIGSIIAPLPPALLVAFIFAGPDSGRKRREPPPFLLIAWLVFGWIGTILSGIALEGALFQLLGNSFPLLAQSAVFSASLFNFFFLRHARTAAFLCGMSSAIATGFIFFQ